MKHTKLLIAMAVAAAFAADAEAVYKCTTAKAVVYQDRPCVEGAQSDVRIVVPTGEVVAKIPAAKGEAMQADAPRSETRAGAAKSERAAVASSPDVTRRDTRANEGTAGARPPSSSTAGNAPSTRNASAVNAAAARTDAGEKRTASGTTEAPMTAEQARNTEPTAKYYTADTVAPGNETPSHMTCESPSGEKRIFILTNGKLTSI